MSSISPLLSEFLYSEIIMKIRVKSQKQPDKHWITLHQIDNSEQTIHRRDGRQIRNENPQTKGVDALKNRNIRLVENRQFFCVNVAKSQPASEDCS